MIQGRGRKINHHKGFAIALWPLAAIIIAWLAVFSQSGESFAASDPFTVRGIAVDATAGSAVAAREEAIAQGHREAFQQLLARLVLVDDLQGMAPVPISEIFALTLDFSVVNERTSGVRYLAAMTVRFREEKVQSFLRRSGLRFAVARSQPVLVLPVYSDNRGTRLWIDNPWYEFWVGNANYNGLLPLLVPAGDLEDINSVSSEAALRLDGSVLSPLAERYGGVDVIVSHLELNGSPQSGNASVRVTSEQFSSGGAARMVVSFDQQQGDNLNSLFARAAQSLNKQLQEAWKLGNLLEFGESREIFVLTYTPDLASWLQIKQELENTLLIEDIDLRALSRVGSDLRISFSGSELQLSEALAEKDLILSLNADREWELTLERLPFPPGLPKVRARRSSRFGDDLPGTYDSRGVGAPGSGSSRFSSPTAPQRGGYVDGEGPGVDVLESEEPSTGGATGNSTTIQAQ